MDNNNNHLFSKIAQLESQVDLLEAELSYLNEILVRCGFQQGITTLKATVEDFLLEEAESYPRPYEN